MTPQATAQGTVRDPQALEVTHHCCCPWNRHIHCVLRVCVCDPVSATWKCEGLTAVSSPRIAHNLHPPFPLEQDPWAQGGE